jgi:hypothetical protein
VFNISGPAFDKIPAFFAYCTGFAQWNQGSNYTECKLWDEGSTRRVAISRLRNKTEEIGAHLSISYRYDDLTVE